MSESAWLNLQNTFWLCKTKHTQFDKQSFRTASNQTLQILPRQLDTIKQSIPNQFPTLFNGLSNMKKHYSTKLKLGAKPWPVHTQEHTPTTEGQSPNSTNRANGSHFKSLNPLMVCCLDGGSQSKWGIRICVDLTPLNQSIFREVTIPKVETIVPTPTFRSKFSQKMTQTVVSGRSSWIQLLVSWLYL